MTRVVELAGGKAQAPFLWQTGSGIPAGGITSVTGKDPYVETDCDGTANCNNGSEPHLMVYDSSCALSGGTWFDLVVGACRQDQ